jgi:hypothetical protein
MRKIMMTIRGKKGKQSQDLRQLGLTQILTRPAYQTKNLDSDTGLTSLLVYSTKAYPLGFPFNGPVL